MQFPSHPYFSKTVHQGVKLTELLGGIDTNDKFFDDYHNIISATGVFPKVTGVNVCHSST